MMADIMIDNWCTIHLEMRKAGASDEQIAIALGAYQAICWRWARTSSVARAFEEMVKKEAPMVYTRCLRPVNLLADITRYELESWPEEWNEEPDEGEVEEPDEGEVE